MSGLWPDGPLPALPHELVEHTQVWWHLHGHRDGYPDQWWWVSDTEHDHFQAAMESAGWAMDADGPLERRRYVSPSDESPAGTGW